MKIAIAAALVVLSTAAVAGSDVSCYTSEGHYIEVPEKKKLVLVPHWWAVNRIEYPLYGAMQLPDGKPRSTEQCPEGQGFTEQFGCVDFCPEEPTLSVSPSVCLARPEDG